MTEISPLSDIRTGSSSGLSSILAQLGVTSGDPTASGDLFSSLVEGTEGLETESLGYTWTPTDAGLATDALVSGDAQDSTEIAQILQDIANLSEALQKILALLQEKAEETAEADQEALADAASIDPETQSLLEILPFLDASAALTLPALEGAATETTEAPLETTEDLELSETTEIPESLATDGSAGSIDETQTLTEVIAEIIALMQTIIQTLHQTPPPAGTSTEPTEETSALDTAAAATASLETMFSEFTPDIGLAENATDLTQPLRTALASMEEKAEQWLNALKESFASEEAITVGSTESSTATLVSEAIAQFTKLEQTLEDAILAYQEAVREALTSATETASDASESTAQSAYVKAAEESLAAQASLTAALTDTDKEETSTAASETKTSTSTTAEETASVTAATTAKAVAVSASTKAATNDNETTDSDDDATTSALENALENGLLAEESVATGTLGFAAHLASVKAAKEGAAGVPGVVDQVILTMNRNVKNGQNQMSLQLQPSELGTITVKLKFSEGERVQGTITADNPKTLDLLQKDAKSLERALQRAGLDTDSGSLEFSLSSQRNQDQTEQANEGSSSEESGEDGALLADGTETGSRVDVETLTETYYVTPTGVNIRV